MYGHKDTTIFEIPKKLSYICIENIKIIIVCEHKKMYDGTIYD